MARSGPARTGDHRRNVAGRAGALEGIAPARLLPCAGGGRAADANPDTTIDPVVSEKQRARVLGYLDQGVKAGAKLLLSGGPATVDGYEHGYYVKPALMTGDSGQHLRARGDIRAGGLSDDFQR